LTVAVPDLLPKQGHFIAIFCVSFATEYLYSVFRFFLVAVLIALRTVVQGQIYGCTDFQALNYMASATGNDGSCIYAPLNVNATAVKQLDSSLNENSALVLHNNSWFTINDGGNGRTLIQIDTAAGTTVHSNKLLGASNVDWEALCVDSKYFYIADVGNNIGARQDLAIYRLPVDSAMSDSTQTQKMSFTYQGQVNYSSNNYTNYDCEAMLVLNDSLFLFTKQWGDWKTRIFLLPTFSSNDTAILIDSFNVNGLITDASYNLNYGVVLLGYDTTGNSFVWLLSDFTGHRFFSGNKRRINMGYSAGQCEGIHLAHDGNIYLTSERFSIFPSWFYRLSTGSFWSSPLSINALRTRGKVLLADGVLHISPECRVKQVNILDIYGRVLSSLASVQNVVVVPAGTIVQVFYADGTIEVLRN
jgi:hypothetical protein